MYEIVFYRTEKGEEPVYEFIRQLAAKRDKDSRINHNKIQEYMQVLTTYGTRAGEPYVKHIDGEIWELRPIRNRIFFAAWEEESFVFLHHFIKKTQKTPQKEIDQAKRELADFRERRTVI